MLQPIPAAAGVLDPTVAPILLAPEYAALLFVAKMYIVSVNEKINNGDGGAIPLPDDVVCSSTPNQQSSFSRAKFLNSKIQAARESSSTLTGHQDTILSQDSLATASPTSARSMLMMVWHSGSSSFHATISCQILVKT